MAMAMMVMLARRWAWLLQKLEQKEDRDDALKSVGLAGLATHPTLTLYLPTILIQVLPLPPFPTAIEMRTKNRR